MTKEKLCKDCSKELNGYNGIVGIPFCVKCSKLFCDELMNTRYRLEEK